MDNVDARVACFAVSPRASDGGTMMGALDLVATSDWVTIVPALLMNGDIDGRQFSVSLIVEPIATLDLVLIEPLRRTLNPAAQAFLDIIKVEAHRLNAVWRDLFSA